MGSSNGVTINGEPFVKTAPLRNGDLIVMGMVKFRFVAPGDHYTFNAKDIDDQNLDQPQTHRDLLFIVLLLLIALISAWLVSKFLFKKNHQPIPTTIEQNQQNQPMPPAELDPADENGQEVIKPLENKAESDNQKMDANLNGEDAPEGKAGETPEEKNDEKPKDQPE
jgi:pSer/pThr/pTyr-binding forkhead associated (FHA) protein